MGGHHQTYSGSGWRQRDALAIVKSTRYPAFWMSAHLIWGTRKRLFDHLQSQKVVVTTRCAITPRPAPRTSISGAASRVVPIQTQQDRSERKPELGSIAGDHLESSQQLATVIPIAWSTKLAQKLMRMCLKDDRTDTHDFSPLAPLITRRTHLIETTMGDGQRFHLRERALAGGLAGPIHVDHHPLLFRPATQAARGSKRGAGQQILLKACAG